MNKQFDLSKATQGELFPGLGRADSTAGTVVRRSMRIPEPAGVPSCCMPLITVVDRRRTMMRGKDD